MQVGTKEHNDLMQSFGHVYQSGEANALFIAYRRGYALGRCVYQ